MTLPYLSGAVSYGLVAYLGLIHRGDIARVLFGATGANENMIYGWLSFLGALFLTAIPAIAIAMIVGAFSLDRIIELSLAEVNLQVDSPSGFKFLLISIWRGVKDAAFQLSVTIVFTLLFLVLWIFPPIAFISGAIWIISLGYSLYDRVLSLLGLPGKKRLFMCKNHIWELSFVGILFAISMLLPFGGIIFIPFLLRAAAINIGHWAELKNTSEQL